LIIRCDRSNCGDVTQLKSNRLNRVVLGLAVATPGLALGAVHAEVLACYLVLAAAMLALLARRPKGLSRVRLDLAGALLIGLIVYTAFQLLPLPSLLVELVSPGAHELRSRALEPLAMDPPSWMPLTLDATLTAAELGKLVLYLAVYWFAMAWTRRHGSSLVLTVVMLAGVAGSAVLLAHKILMLERIYDFYTPLHAAVYQTERVSAPLINENHMGAFLGLAAAAAIGQALAASSRSRRLLMIGTAALIGGSLLLTLSRGAIAAFVAGQAVFVVLRLLQRRFSGDTGGRRRHLAWLPLGLVLSLGLGLFAAQDAIIGEFLDGSYHKIEILREGLPLVGEFPAVGVGRGAFWVAFPLVSEWGSTVTFTHAENAVLQLLVDWGVLAGLVALLGFGLIVARRLLKPPARIRPTAALAGLVAFGLHNLIDFNMEVPGVAVMAAALLGTLVGSEAIGRDRSQQRRHAGRKVPAPVLAVAGVVALALSAAALFYVSRHGLDQEERKLRAAIARDDSQAFAPSELEPLLNRHPAAWYIPFLAGVHSYHARVGNPLPWLARALEINPASASAHLYAGRSLLRLGKLDQALLELRLAGRGNSRLAPAIARFLVAAEPSFERLSKIALDRRDKLLLWEPLAREFSAQGHESEAAAADLAVLSIDPLEPRSLARHARRLIKRGKLDEAIELARQLEELEDYRPAAAILRAEAHRARGAPVDELAALEQGLAQTPKHAGLLRELAWAAQRNGDHDRAIAAARELKSAATDQAQRTRATILEGDLERKQGRIDAALARYRQAYAMDPSNQNLLVRIANLAESHGDMLRALEALRKLVNLDPTNDEWQRRLDAIEKRGRTKAIEIP
jgi:tetratricopeptide (TPR) repeat protein